MQLVRKLLRNVSCNDIDKLSKCYGRDVSWGKMNLDSINIFSVLYVIQEISLAEQDKGWGEKCF